MGSNIPTEESRTKFSNESDSNVTDSSLIDDSVAQKYLTDSNEAQEFFVLNQDTGQYQKYVYIPPPGLENLNRCHELEATVDVEELQIKDRLTLPSSELEGNTIILGEKTKVPSNKYKNRRNEKDFKDDSINNHTYSSNNSIAKRQERVTKEYRLPYEKPLLELKTAPDQQIDTSKNSNHPRKESNQLKSTKRSDKYSKYKKPDEYRPEHHVNKKFATKGEQIHNYKICDICKQHFESLSKYFAHLKDEHPNVVFGCPLCPQSYHSPELLNIHYNNSHPDGKIERPSSSSPASTTKPSQENIQSDKAFFDDR